MCRRTTQQEPPAPAHPAAHKTIVFLLRESYILVSGVFFCFTFVRDFSRHLFPYLVSVYGFFGSGMAAIHIFPLLSFCFTLVPRHSCVHFDSVSTVFWLSSLFSTTFFFFAICCIACSWQKKNGNFRMDGAWWRLLPEECWGKVHFFCMIWFFL